MKATVIVDNIPNGEIPGEWGLCIQIEYRGKSVLLDTGASALFAENAVELGIDLEKVDYAVLSHAHYDHANGMERFFQLNKSAKFYLQEQALDNCYFKALFLTKYIGIPKGICEKYEDRIVRCSGKTKIDDGIWILGHSTPGLDKIGRREKMVQKKGRRYLADDFSHEQSLIFETEKGLVIFNSCCHGGADTVIEEAKRAFPDIPVYALIGGFHIFKMPEKKIRALGDRIRDTGIGFVCTGHCSGKRGYELLHDQLGDKVHRLEVGLEMEF